MLLELFAHIAQLFPQIYLCSAHCTHVPNVIWPPEFIIIVGIMVDYILCMMREVVVQIYLDIFSILVTPVCCAQLLSCVQPFVIPWTVTQQAVLSMEFSR